MGRRLARHEAAHVGVSQLRRFLEQAGRRFGGCGSIGPESEREVERRPISPFPSPSGRNTRTNTSTKSIQTTPQSQHNQQHKQHHQHLQDQSTTPLQHNPHKPPPPIDTNTPYKTNRHQHTNKTGAAAPLPRQRAVDRAAARARAPPRGGAAGRDARGARRPAARPAQGGRRVV